MSGLWHHTNFHSNSMPWQKHGLINFTEGTNRRKEPGRGKKMPILKTTWVKNLRLNSHFVNLGVQIWIVRLSAMPKVLKENRTTGKKKNYFRSTLHLCHHSTVKIFLEAKQPACVILWRCIISDTKTTCICFLPGTANRFFFFNLFIFKITSRCSKAGENNPPIVSTFSHL